MQVCLSQSTVLKKFVDTLFAECIHTLAVHMQVTLVGLAGFVDCSNERISNIRDAGALHDVVIYGSMLSIT